ncbi:TKL/STKR/TYPE2 protein kinase [Aphelenchoides avenae]|nr:TKL/STKR/TYPE2 protein kinase [Aphelenchus avenae]
MFCCCRTHNCNHNFTFRPQEEPTTEFSTPQGHSLPVVMLSTKGFNALIVVLVLSSVLAMCGLVYWGLRKQRMQYKLGSKSSSNVLSLGSFDKGYESTTLLGNKKENLREITLLEDVYALKAVRSHPNVVDFVAAFQNNDKYWLVTVYHKNGSLCDYLKENVLSLEASTKIISTMLEGLAFLHEETIVGEESKPSVVHRDFKSKNVLIKDDLTTCITDFGLALKCENGRMSEDSHGQVGTPRYMAPEMLEGATEFSAFAFQQIDVYAAGLVLWEVLSRTRVPEDEENAIPDYLLPYEKEAGPSPSLGQIREIVVIRKSRPEVREAQLQNKSSRTIVKTIREMWDKEPDGRITSARARDRMVRLYESLQSGTASSASREEVENDGCDLSP